MKISVVVPVYNEQDGIVPLRENLIRFEKTLPTFMEREYVFVDDGSSDRTLSSLYSVFGQSPECIIVSHEGNRGIGAAFRTGFAHATGDIVCTIDADCTYRPEKLMDLVNAMQLEKADIAVASPYHPNGGVVGVARWRLVLSKGCSFLYRRRSKLKLYTYTSVFRAYRAEVVKQVKFGGNGFVAASEILIQAAKCGFTVTEVPMVLYARRVGQSKMKLAKTIRTHLRLLLTGKTGDGNPVVVEPRKKAVASVAVAVQSSKDGVK